MKTEELIIKENSRYIVGTKLQKGGMVEIETGTIKDDIIDIVIWSLKNGQCLNLGNKNVLELKQILERDGYKEMII